MMKKILGGTLVASALLLISCGYSQNQQKSYDACMETADVATIKELAKSVHIEVTGDTKEKACDSIAVEVGKRLDDLKSKGATQAVLDDFANSTISLIKKTLKELTEK